MSNKYCTLIGNNEIKHEYQKINTGFDKVDEDFSSIDERVVNLINNPDGTKDLEIVDARHSAAKGKIFETLDARLEEAEQDHKTHWADIATLRFSEEATEYGNIFSVNPATVQGAMKGNVKGFTAQNLVKNGNFADGTTEWNVEEAFGFVAVNGIAEFTANARYGRINHYTSNRPSHKMFFSAHVLSDSNAVRLYLNDGKTQNLVSHSGSGKFEYLCAIMTVSESAAVTAIKIQDDRSSDWTKVQVKDVMVIDITAENLEDKTLDELNAIFSHYIDGLQSVQPQEIKSVGKNLFDIRSNFFIRNGYGSPNVLVDKNTISITKTSPNGRFIAYNIPVIPGNTYSISYSNRTNVGIGYTQSSQFLDYWAGYGIGIGISGSSFIAINRWVQLYVEVGEEANSGMILELSFEAGAASSKYISYQESKAYTKYPLRSLPNGTCDEVDLQSGKLTKRCEEYVLQENDILALTTTDDNIDRVVTKAFFNAYISPTSSDHFNVHRWARVREALVIYEPQYIGYVYQPSVTKSFVFIVAKDTYADLAAAQAALAGTKIVYQLAQEQIIEDALSNQLTVYPSGTISNKARKQYVLKAEDITGTVISGVNADLIIISKPVDAFAYGKTTGSEGSFEFQGYSEGYFTSTNYDSVSNIGKVSAVYNTDTFRLAVVKGTTLAEAQAALAGTIITYGTKPELSTIPVTVHSESINLAGAVKSESDRNTRQDEQINDITLLLDYLIVVNA